LSSRERIARERIKESALVRASGDWQVISRHTEGWVDVIGGYRRKNRKMWRNNMRSIRRKGNWPVLGDVLKGQYGLVVRSGLAVLQLMLPMPFEGVVEELP
jgi:hypothetical protein